MEERLLTTKEVLSYLRINKLTLYRLIWNKKLPVMKVGHNYRYRKEDLDKWLSSQK